ncbi:MAG: hypothetical protein Ct9H90mP27_5980 [Gammaproteobacteria bacterium]|nr:MAG: hypothetical protein Ct9H90mP27_5980 [Gammaproteobacteria bacterium]
MPTELKFISVREKRTHASYRSQIWVYEFGGECIPISADLSNLDGINNFVQEFSKHETSLDILVNNAGVAWGAPLEEFPELGWDKVMNTNVKGVFFPTQQLSSILRKHTPENPAHVINVGSVTESRLPFLIIFLRSL